ncbi:MAG: type II secretion system protein [Candidatus Omnitrophota bacterium]|jgi:type II secretory pathway pseudopilin PulG
MNKRSGFTVIELVVVTAIFFAMIAVLAPFVNMAKNRAHTLECMENLRRISLGLHAYALDHNEAFPAALGELYPNYIDNQNVFDCPASKAAGTKDKSDYNYKAGLTESSNPKEILVEDFDGNHGKAGKNILKRDGSVEWVKAAW